jgi:acetyltransferase-like isoleucine patch superfamily enzyme
MDTDFHKIKDVNNKIVNEPQEIIIGEHVWIGCRCLILKGSKIKKGTIIGANASIIGELEYENSIYVGNPAKCIRRNITWEK